MKKITTLLAIIISASIVFAQAPQKMSYQTVIRDNSGILLANQPVGIKITILRGSPAGTVSYSEIFTPNPSTNINGLLSLEIGTGIAAVGALDTIDWGNGNYFIKTETDPTGGTSYTITGTSQLLSVPYALYAENGGSGTVTSVIAGTGLNGGTITNTGTISMPNVGTPNTYGSASQIPVITTDAQGRVSSVTTVPVGSSTGWSLTGNSATTNSNFLGTTDNKSLRFRTNNLARGIIDTLGNFGIGTITPSAKLEVVGGDAIINGIRAGQGGGSGINNLYFGIQGMTASSGLANTAIGLGALQLMTTGDNNTALGYSATQNITAGNANTSVGCFSLYENRTGSGNTGIGYSALLHTYSGSDNTAIGNYADLLDSTISNATAIGAGAMVGASNCLVLGNNANVGIGISSPLRKLDVQSNNAGHVVGIKNSNAAGTASIAFVDNSGIEKLYIGYANPSYSNAALAGNSYINSGSNPLLFATFNVERMRITNTGNLGIGTTTPGGLFELGLDQGRKPSTSTWTITSDARLKNIDGAYTKGLKEIMQLNPVSYHYKNAGERIFNEQVLNTQEVGFTAQEVEKVFPECVGKDDDGYLNLNIHAILVAQVNAIKEQQNEIESMKKQIEDMNALIQKLSNK